MTKSTYYAQLSVGNYHGDFRWTVKENGDFPGAIDLLYQEYDSEEHRWVTKQSLSGIELVVLQQLTSAAQIVCDWADKDQE